MPPKLQVFFVCKSVNRDPDPDVIEAGSRISVVHEFKYLGMIIHVNLLSLTDIIIELTLKTEVKKFANRIKFYLENRMRNLRKLNEEIVPQKHMRNNLTTEASKLYIHAMVLSHINYCLTRKAQTGGTTLVETLHKAALKTLNTNSNSYHH